MLDQVSRTLLGTTFGLFVALGAIGCGDGGSGEGGSGGTTNTGGSTSSGGTGGAGGMTSSGGTGGTGGVAAPEFAALVRGTLFTTDLAMAKEKHDGIAGGGEAAAKAAGDIAHDVLLGTTMLGTEENQFLGIDRWTDAQAMNNFYMNPDLQAAFGTLFSGPPSLEAFQRQPTWHTWGDMDAGDSFDPYFFVVVRGKLKEADPAKAQAAHDAVAGGGEAQVTAAGDVAHIVFTGLQDPQEFFAIDIWKASDNLEAVYTNPDFQAAFGGLFEGTPTLAVYQSTDWHQW